MAPRVLFLQHTLNRCVHRLLAVRAALIAFQAPHTSFVKVIYDYEAAAPGELSVKEDDVLLAFETEGDWILAQSQSEDGGAGYVPGNYVEATSEGQPAAVAAPALAIVVPEDVCPLFAC